jgi:hypothetical protein
METEREPDTTEDPRRQGTGQGYPESNPEETTPREGTESGPGAGTGGEGDGDVAPSTSTGEEADREASTGNPDAAG